MTKNKGKGAAIRKSVNHVKGKYIFFMDADMSTELQSLLIGVEQLEKGYDIVIGSRYHKLSKITKYHIPIRKFTSKIFRILCNILFNFNISDTQCGFKGFKREVFIHLFSVSTINRFMIDVELLFQAKCFRYSIIEIPIFWKYHGDSTVGTKDIFRSLIELSRIYHKKIKFQIKNKYQKKIQNSKMVNKKY